MMFRTFNQNLLLASLLALSLQAQAHKESCELRLSIPAGAAFEPHLLSQTRLGDKNGWELKWHTNNKGEVQLLAIQKATLLVRRLDPLTGKVISEKQYLANAKQSSTPAAVRSSPKGELLIAALGGDNKIELYSDASETPAGIKLDSAVQDLEVISLKSGDVFVIASTANSLNILKRQGPNLNLVASIKSQADIRQSFAFAGLDNDINLAILGSDHRVRVLNYDTDVETLEEKPGFVQLGGKLHVASADGRLMFLATEDTREGTTVRFVMHGLKKPVARDLNLPRLIGTPLWGEKAAYILLPVRSSEGSILKIMNPLLGRQIEDITLGDARAITDLSQFNIGSKVFYVFTKDGTIAYIQNENEVSIVPAPERSSIKQTTEAILLPNGQAALAVLGQSLKGVSVNVIGLTGGQKVGVTPPTATAE